MSLVPSVGLEEKLVVFLPGLCRALAQEVPELQARQVWWRQRGKGQPHPVPPQVAQTAF